MSNQRSRLLTLSAVWSLVTLFFASEYYMAAVMLQPRWADALRYAIPAWLLWALFTPVILLLKRRIPFAHDRLLFAITFHLFASAVAAFAHISLHSLLTAAIAPSLLPQGLASAIRFRLQISAHLQMLTYWAILGVAYALDYYKLDQARAVRASSLAASLAEARLQALQMELNPHILFNALNAISALIYSDPRTAERMIARLGELFRLTLEIRNRQQISLREELQILRCYLAIEQMRFNEQLKLTLTVDDDVGDAAVPSLILQPVVENAINHGVSTRAFGGEVSIIARRAEDALVLQVIDNGNGGTASADHTGLGLANTRARLAQLYGGNFRLVAERAEQGGFITMIKLPYQHYRPS